MKDIDKHINRWTDTYFKHTKEVVNQNGDVSVTYAVFIRRPVVSAPPLRRWRIETAICGPHFQMVRCGDKGRDGLRVIWPRGALGRPTCRRDVRPLRK